MYSPGISGPILYGVLYIYFKFIHILESCTRNVYSLARSLFQLHCLKHSAENSTPLLYNSPLCSCSFRWDIAAPVSCSAGVCSPCLSSLARAGYEEVHQVLVGVWTPPYHLCHGGKTQQMEKSSQPSDPSLPLLLRNRWPGDLVARTQSWEEARPHFLRDSSQRGTASGDSVYKKYSGKSEHALRRKTECSSLPNPHIYPDAQKLTQVQRAAVFF